MVQLGGFEKFRQLSNKVPPPPPPPPEVKLEVEDQLEEENGPFYKKMKKQWNDTEMVPPQSLHKSLLEEPSPLGLRLRKSPSLLDLIQTRLSEENSSKPQRDKSNLGFEAGRRKDLKSSASVTNEKLKASNFPASLLRIGSWERVSKYEDDLVAKCYYAKQKLVWEVLDGGLKSKIEIQWSDITAIKATYPDNVPGTLDIVLARQPLFFREINPQPRKHTLWQATTDFTNGQASMHRRHFLQCPPGLLNKHFEKLVQCDKRLHLLSQQPDIILESPYFDHMPSVLEDHNESNRSLGFVDLKLGFNSSLQGPHHHVLASTPLTSTNLPTVGTQGNIPTENFPPCTATGTHATETNASTSKPKDLLNDPKHWDQIKVPGLNSSMSMSDLVNHLGNCISGKTTPGTPLFEVDSSLNKATLEDITQKLLGDSQFNSAADEQSLMARINSFCCLIQQEDDDKDDAIDDEENNTVDDRGKIKEEEPVMLMNLPRIQSMPQFLFNVSKDREN